MFKVRDNVYSDRWATMSDGFIVKFVNQLADVPDVYVEYFRNISDFQVMTHIEDASPVNQTIAEPPASSTEEATIQPEVPQVATEVAVETAKEEKPPVEIIRKKTFNKIIKSK